MAETGYATSTGKIVLRGVPSTIIEKNVETATNVYPGRLVTTGTTDYDVKVADGLAPPIGFAGYEHTTENYRPEAMTTIYTAGDDAAILRGQNFSVLGKMAAGFTAIQGDYVVSWGAGCVAPAAIINGKTAVRIAFTKKTSEFDTSVDIPTGAIISDCFVQVVTEAGSSTIDIGILSGEAGGNAAGFVDDESCAAKGFVAHNLVDATAANITLGVLLDEVQIKDATGTPVYTPILLSPGMVCDGTAISVSYTTSNHTIAGYFWLVVSSPGIQIVGKAGKSLSSSTSAQDLPIDVMMA